ncbi:MFS transporter [Ruegeria sp. 2012CJ41-6]|uniref:MFS transporter n=1 Tax=Ruegeria spongiae TaxID=2942209 RepID=A0ABT0PY81_9RHOB|nr:MFS transporter [Ruegeria spongiae]MCL6282578.1 MFS transporter [Ruegeria spongiae]
MFRTFPAALLPFLLLLFVGTVCSAMIVPYMGFFIVNGLGHEPWTISIYAGLVSCLAILVNRNFAVRLDGGANAFPLIGIAATAFLIANLVLSIAPVFWVVLSVGVLGFGISTSTVSTLFSLGGSMAERHGIARSRFNAYMRATTSTAWMIGPAVSFLVADQLGATAVFKLSAILSLLWLALWWRAVPHDMRLETKDDQSSKQGQGGLNTGLWLAAAFVFCLSTAHSLTFSALPLYYVQEVGLPGYAPGTAFSVKTFVEVFAIFSTPYLIARFGLRRSLLAVTLLAIVTIQVLASVESYPQMLAGAAMEGFYYGLYASLGISFVQSFAPNRPARATALYWNTLMVTGILAGPAAGLIAQAYDFRTVILVASGVACVAAIVLVLGSLSQNRRPSHS